MSLLELARGLIELAANDRAQPIPAVFNLSTWKGEPLGDWLIQELSVWYRVPVVQGSKWLSDGRLVLLLDGLDEVSLERRSDCVRAINQFVHTTRFGGLAVCSRLQEYTSLAVPLAVNAAVCLQPLTPSQIQEYLTAGDGQLEALRLAIRSDPELQALANTPLMLNLMSAAYEGLTVDALSGTALDTVEERREHLFTNYVRRMFERHVRAASTYPRDRMVRGLTWLARQMRQHTESSFLLERLQPDWLKTRSERWAYTVSSRVLCGAALGLVLGAILDVTLGMIAMASAGLAAEARDFLTYLKFGLIFGVLNGIIVGLVDGWRFERSRWRKEARSGRTPKQVLLDVAAYVLGLGLVNWLFLTIAGGFDEPASGLMFGFLVGLLFGLLFGIHDSRRGVSDDIRTVEALHWSWAGVRQTGTRGLLGGTAIGAVLALVGVIIGVPIATEPHAADWLIAGILLSLSGGVLGAVVGAAFGGLKSSTIESKAVPNEGIRLSVRNAVLAGVVAGVLVGGLVGGATALFASGAQAANAGVLGGLFFGLLAGLRNGGFDVIQHYTLRVALAARGYAPLDYSRFLDCAAALIFLQKAGGGYLFVHRLLLEYFAEREESPGPALASAPAAAVPIAVRS